MKQYEGVQSNQENINNLVEAVQNAQNGHSRSKALDRLWDIVGDSIMGGMVGKSYRMNSDFDMNGYSPRERRNNLASDGYMVFCGAVMNFDLNLGVPFLAYIVQKLGWKLASDKRDNAKRDDRIKISSKMPAIASDDFTEKDAFDALLERTPNEDDVEGDCFRVDAVDKIKGLAASDSKAAAYFETCKKLCDQGLSVSDAEVARYMGCTRASVGNYRKRLVRLIAENGLDFNSLVVVAA
jgi:hypothetical protein